MSPNATSVQNDKQSLQYIVRSGLAGGIAGCVVCVLIFCCEAILLIQLARQRLSLHRWTELKYYSKHTILISRNMQVCIRSAWSQKIFMHLSSRIMERHITCWERHIQTQWAPGTVSRSFRYTLSCFPLRGHKVHGVRSTPRRECCK
jgi:hypothetical protein